jgi:hypothetical protein
MLRGAVGVKVGREVGERTERPRFDECCQHAIAVSVITSQQRGQALERVRDTGSTGKKVADLGRGQAGALTGKSRRLGAQPRRWPGLLRAAKTHR